MVSSNKNCEEGLLLVKGKKISAQLDEGFRSYEHFKTADSYTQQNFDNFGKYAILVNMEAFILGQVRMTTMPPRTGFRIGPQTGFHIGPRTGKR